MSEDSHTPPPEGLEPTGEAAMEKGPFGGEWDRRTLFKGAALGTAAAAMYTGGRMAFGPLSAYADNLSGLNCTANDVRIIGPGIILNEPCACTGTFNAQVQFRVENNTGTTRYCVTVHFCPGALPGGGTFDPGDVLIGDIPPKSNTLYTVTIPNYPCGSGLVCFGAAGPEADGGFPKGAACPVGECCTTISWDVNPGCPSRVISSKCRHQQVCIQGRGGVTLDCDTSQSGTQSNCAVQCGSTTTVRLCTTEAASFGPFVFTLTGGGSTQTFTGAGPCHDFTVGPITDTTTFTGTVKSNDGCTKTASVTITTTPLTASIAATGTSNCNGVVTLTASVQGGSGCTYAWADTTDPTNVVALPGTGAAINYGPVLDGACHRIRVIAQCGGCNAEATVNVRQCVQTTTGCTLG